MLFIQTVKQDKLIRLVCLLTVKQIVLCLSGYVVVISEARQPSGMKFSEGHDKYHHNHHHIEPSTQT